MTQPCRYCIGTVSREQSGALQALRQAAYRAAPEFDWNEDASLGWTPADEHGTVLGLWDAAGRMLSTTRATVLHSVGHAEDFLEYSLAGIDIAWPSLALSRAATAPDVARHGLFALLRHAYLSALVADSVADTDDASTGIGSVVAIVYEGGPRLAAMRAAGYDFFSPRAGWDSEAVARTAPLLAVLPGARFRQANDSVAAGLAARLDEVQVEREAIAAALREQVARLAGRTSAVAAGAQS